ncbi:hypothetical protein KAU04_05775 [bacterium]|nr:hypothetical protein [bacterium]
MARRATVINQKLERESAHLIVDSGNFCRARGQASERKTETLVRAMSLMGYDAINLAREEIILGSRRILELRDKERLPLVSSNLYRRNSDRLLVHPYVIKRLGWSSFLGFQYGGIKVAIMGLTSEVVRDKMAREIPMEFYVPKPEVVLQNTVQKLKKHCDVVIVLSDLDLREATRLAREVGGIDLFFIAKGAERKYAKKVNETIFVIPATAGNELGDVELILDDHNSVKSFEIQWTLLDKSVADDEEMVQLMAEYNARRVAPRQSSQSAGKK